MILKQVIHASMWFHDEAGVSHRIRMWPSVKRAVRTQ